MTRFILVLLALLVPACHEPVKEKTRADAPDLVWQTVGTWSGHGNGQTGSFNVETGALRIHWEARAASSTDSSAFKLWLHSAISGRPLQMAVDHKGPGQDIAYIEDEPRVSYFLVEAGTLDWSVTLEEAAPGRSR
jgi:hypothetical protein